MSRKGHDFPAYLVLLRVGFTLPPALLPARCALTAPFHPYRFPEEKRRYRLCGTGRRCVLKPISRALPGTLPRGVRTFLPQMRQTHPAAIVQPACSPSIPIAPGVHLLGPLLGLRQTRRSQYDTRHVPSGNMDVPRHRVVGRLSQPHAYRPMSDIGTNEF